MNDKPHYTINTILWLVFLLLSWVSFFENFRCFFAVHLSTQSFFCVVNCEHLNKLELFFIYKTRKFHGVKMRKFSEPFFLYTRTKRKRLTLPVDFWIIGYFCVVSELSQLRNYLFLIFFTKRVKSINNTESHVIQPNFFSNE